jgi:hypothetical protein
MQRTPSERPTATTTSPSYNIVGSSNLNILYLQNGEDCSAVLLLSIGADSMLVLHCRG